MNLFLRGSVPVLVALVGTAFGQEPTIRSTAVVDLTFDEMNGAAEDHAAAGAVKDAAQPNNEAGRVTSPFWNVTAGQAARFDADRKQYFQVADSADLDHADGTTLSFYFLNLHPLTDATFHGITAKRHPSEQKTSYGLNFQPSSKKLQVYIHDGSGFKVVGFPLEQAFGFRRLTHLTATFGHGDAPEPDADTDADDLQIRLFINGKPLKPMDALGGSVTEDSGWIPDVNKAGLLNDTPLTIGGSFASGETFSGLIDEYLVFNRPLSIEEAAKLFAEVAGPDGDRLAKQETEGLPSADPVINNVVPRSAPVGATTRLTIAGRNLGPEPTISLPGVSATVTILPRSTAERLIVDVTVPDHVQPAIVPLAVRTATGLSSPVPLPVDRFPQRALPGENETATLPAAFTGRLNGAERHRIAFDGKQGQRFVAEVELKRFGGKADPVLELKSEAGVPIEIAWGRSIRGGDPRLVTTLPHDGRYVLELHDLAWKAAPSSFRLIAGEMTLLDAVVPSTVESGTSSTGQGIGIGLADQAVQVTAITDEPVAKLDGPVVDSSQGAIPVVPVEPCRVLDEQQAITSGIDALSSPVCIAGQLSKAGEVDRFAVQATAGKALEIRVEAKSIGSPVEPVVAVFEGAQQVGRDAARPGTGQATLKITPEDPSGKIEITLGDRLSGSEGTARPYQLRIVPAGTPHLKVTLLDASVVLPRVGRGVLRFRIERGGPVGDVRLVPDDISGIILDPAIVPAGKPVEEVFVTVSAVPGREPAPFTSFIAETALPDQTLRVPVRVSAGQAMSQFDSTRPFFDAPIAVTPAAPSVELVRAPQTVFKGATDSLALKVAGELPEGYAIRYSLVSDEAVRPVDPKKPAGEKKPLVHLSEDAVAMPGSESTEAKLLIPADVAAKEVRAVVKAEVVPHAWSNQVVAVGYSSPLELVIQEAIATAAAESNLLSAGENELAITMQRSDGFAQPVKVELRGLPKGYSAKAIDVPAEQSAAMLKIIVPDGTTTGPVPNVELAILDANGSVLKSIKPFALSVQPKED